MDHQQSIESNGDPEDLQTLEGLGQVHYQRHNLEKARGYWEQALELDPDNTDLRQKLHSLEDEEAMDDDFRKIKSPHFDIRAEEGALEKGDYALRRILRNIYRKVSQDMKFFTQRQIIVLIYTESGYQQLRQTPHWSMGLFDGKIRIPIPSDQGGWPGIESIIRHEFTHALVWERTRDNCPPWLNEGLAQYEQRGGRRSKMPSEAIQLLKEEETLKISLEVLTNPFVEWTDVKLIPRGYAKSESLVRYLIRRYGMGKMHRILDALGEGGKPEAILEAELATTLAGLEKSWSRAVKSGNRAF